LREPADRRLLLVDDEEPILFAMDDYFSARGWVVDCARARDEAEALLAGRRYAAVIADLRLATSSDVDGLEMLSAVRRLCPATRTILLTAYGSPATERQARASGIDAVLQKPQPLAEVAGVLERLLASAPPGS
jgi:DNA-binding response OmpR family regulator